MVARYAQTDGLDEPVAMLRNATTSYYETDGLGTVTSLSNSAGALAETYTYDSFGNTTNSSGSLTNPFQYTAREFDPETGLYYYRARYYDPTSGRFLSEDPIVFYGGINFYSYVRGNPVKYSDLLGLSPSSVVISFVKGAASGAAGAVIVGGLAFGAVTLGAPVAAVTISLGVAAVVSAPVLGFDIYCNIKGHNWNGLAFNFGSLAGSSVAGGLEGRTLAEGINGVPSPPWSLGSDWGDRFNPSLGSIGDWLRAGASPGSAAGSAALAGAGGATAVHGICGCN